MTLHTLQQQAYDNKTQKKFNTTDVSKELNGIVEELGELADGFIQQNKEVIIDSLGDTMIYCLGLSTMFGWNANSIIPETIKTPEKIHSLHDYFPYTQKEIGMLNKTYKKSNKKKVANIDRKEDFKKHLGHLMKYCLLMLDYVQADAYAVLENIVEENKKREHHGRV
jgi:NTP pyrophosphatase (non-canonical NTP hydrolase)